MNSIDTVLEGARTMTWKGLNPIVELLDETSKNGVRIAKKACQKIEKCFERDESFPK